MRYLFSNHKPVDNYSKILYQFQKVALDLTPPTPPRVRGGSDFIYSISLKNGVNLLRSAASKSLKKSRNKFTNY